MKKIIIFWILILFSGCKLTSQIVEMTVKPNPEKDKFNLDIILKNKGEKPIQFYIPNSDDDFCESILIIELKDDSGNVHRYYPCGEFNDIEKIDLYDGNNIILGAKEQHHFSYKLKIKDFSPFINQSTKYQLLVTLNYKDVIFGNATEQVFTGLLRSPAVEYKTD
jgi:hypothetical protein